MKISTIVNYCTRHDRFFDKLIENLLPFNDHILVVVSNKFFDNVDENHELLQKRMDQYKNIIWLKTDFDTYKDVPQWAKAWHSRYLAYNHLQNDSSTKSDYVLFLDADEIVEPSLFKQFKSKIEWGSNYRFANYVYFREPKYRATTLEFGPVMLFTHTFDINTVYKADRNSMFELSNDPKYDNFTLNNNVMIHHFSWIGTKEQLLEKIKGWGHAGDKNWGLLIEEEFNRDFNGTDFINNHKYEIVENNIL